MLDKDNWEENKIEAKELAQEFIYDEKRKSECVKYFISHFKISSATAYRWYDKIYNELSIPTVTPTLHQPVLHSSLSTKDRKNTFTKIIS